MGTRLAHIDRARRIAQTLVRHGFFGLVDQLGLGDGRLVAGHGPGERVAARFGRRLSLALNDLGPTYVKLGQFLSTREDLFPAAVVRELAELQDGASLLPARVVRREVEAALGLPVSIAFAGFDDEPLAAGSIAQVHAARLRDGRDVVVKVRRPRLARRVVEDLALLRWLAARAAERSPDLARLDPVGLVEELGASLERELDFGREAACLRQMAAVVSRTARVPQVIDRLCADGVLTMERIDGTRLSDVPAAVDRQALARKLVACFCTQYLAGSMFHADPHGGNVLHLADGSLALLDLGAVGAVDPRMRKTLLRLAAAAARRDGRAMADAALAIMHAPAELDLPAYQRDMGALLDRAVRQSLGAVSIGALLGELFGVARAHHLRVRAEYFLLFRSAMLIDGLLRSLDPAIDPVAEARRHIVRNALSRQWLVPAAALAAHDARGRAARLLRPRPVRLALAVAAVTTVIAAMAW